MISEKFIKVFKWILIILVLIVTIGPFIWLVLTSFKLEIDFFSKPLVILPSRITFKHYEKVLSDPSFKLYLFNSLLVSLVSTAISVFIGSLAAYSVSRHRFPFKFERYLSLYILFTITYPAISVAIPYFAIIKSLNLLDTQIAIILTYIGFGSPMTFWYMLGFFKEFPHEIEEASMIDGCNVWQTFTRIVLPASVSGIVAAFTLVFILLWNEFLFANILSLRYAKTVPVFLAGYITDKSLEWGPIAATSTMFSIPVILLMSRNKALNSQ